MLRSKATAIALALALGGCIVPIDNDIAPCTSDGQCLPGYYCTQGFCLPSEAALEPRGVGPIGGEVIGPQGVVLEVPPDAVEGEVVFDIQPASRGTFIAGVELLSEAYSVEPSDVTLQVDATLTIPVPPLPQESNDNIGVWRYEPSEDTWRRLDGECEYKIARAKTDRGGLFVAGRVQ